MLFTYRPDQIKISFGLPNLDLGVLGIGTFENPFVTMKDWVSFTGQKNSQRFTMTRGIFGESFLEFNSDTSRVFSLTLLQTSDDVIKLRNLFTIQTFGILGFPLFINDLSGQGIDLDPLRGINLNVQRQKSAYPVAVILDEPEEGWSLDGGTWIFRIGVTYGQTIYI